jgi:hypothetical protein
MHDGESLWGAENCSVPGYSILVKTKWNNLLIGRAHSGTVFRPLHHKDDTGLQIPKSRNFSGPLQSCQNICQKTFF